MNSDQLRIAILKWLAEEEKTEPLNRVLSLIEDLEFEKQSEKKVMGLRANGMEVTKAELLRCIRISEEQAERGELLGFDELEKHSQTW